MAKVIEEKEEQTPVEDESGGIVTTVKENVTKDLDVQQLIDDNETSTEEKPPAKKVEPKPAAKKNDDDDTEEDWFTGLTPEQKREVGKVFKDRRANARKLRELESTVEELKRRPTTREEDPVAPKTARTIPPYGARPQKPDPTKFNSPAEFEEAETRHEDDLYEWRKAKEAHERAEAAKVDAQAAAIKTHNERQAKFAETHDDYEDVIDNDLPMSDIMFGAVVEEEVGPALAYHLAQNPELNNKIYAMTPQQQIKALMRLIVKLESDDEEKPPKEEKAVAKKVKQPEPAAPVGGRQASKIDTQKMSFKERERQFARDNPGTLGYEP